MLLAVPNFSEGRDAALIEAISRRVRGRRDAPRPPLGPDPQPHRLDARGRRSGPRLSPQGAAACVERIEMGDAGGRPPADRRSGRRAGRLHLDEEARNGARSAALAAAVRIADARDPGLPLRRPRECRGAPRARLLPPRRAVGARAPARGRGARTRPRPRRPLHPSAGATLVTARPPLAAFNVLLDTGEIEIAVAVAAELRESGGGPPGVRAIAVDLDGRAQVSTNVHDPLAVPLGDVIERIRGLAAKHGARPVEAELVGLIPEAAVGAASRRRPDRRLRPRPPPDRAPARA